MGDNEVQTDDEERFTEVYASQFERLSDELEGWYKAEGPVVHPPSGDQAWLQNLRFEHKGVLFVGLDTVIRGIRGRLGDLGSLNDYPGGVGRSYKTLSRTRSFDRSSIVCGSRAHHVGRLEKQMAEVATVLGPVGEYVYAHFAGHLHFDFQQDLEARGMELYVTDATWDDEISLRVVQVSGNEYRMAYSHKIVVVPPNKQ